MSGGMSFDFLPSSYGELKDRVRLWAESTGLASYTGGLWTASGAGANNQSGDSSGSQGAFSSRIEIVQRHLNLPFRPTLLNSSAELEHARFVLRQAYRDEPTFQWLLGDLKRGPDGTKKTEALLEWIVDWKINQGILYSQFLAIPLESEGHEGDGTQNAAVRGCALVTYPGSKSEIHQLLTLLNTGRSPPKALGPQCANRFAALEHMGSARDRLAGMGPHWYIHMLGINPSDQRKGVGRMIMRIICALADQDDLPIHLEVSGSRNRSFFEQCGFRAMQSQDITSEDSPTLKIHLMTRVPFPKTIELE